MKQTDPTQNENLSEDQNNQISEETISEEPVAEPPQKKKWLIPLIALGVILIIGAVAAKIGNDKYQAYLERQAIIAAEDAELKNDAYILTIDTFHRHAVENVSNGSGENVAEALAKSGIGTLDGIKNRPPYVDLTAENSAHFANVESALISSATGMVEVTVTADALPKSDDGYYYLFSKAMYEDEISGEPITKAEKDVDFTISCNLNYNTASSRLFDKFCVAVLKDGEYLPVSNSKYITNPAARAAFATSRDGVGSKKGLLIDPFLMNSGQLGDLGVKHAAYNIYTSLILNGGGINYTYNGHTYSFNAHQVGLYDLVFSSLTRQGIDVNAIIINDLANSTITHPGGRGSAATLYAFNATDEEGINMLAAVGNFLANRYSGGSGHGKVSNWIIGNEVNERTVYNMMPYMSVSEYAQAYADVVRVFYNSMASVNATTRVYLSLDQRWDMNKSDNSFYDVRDMMDAMNSYIVSEGNFDWHVGFHPYNYPLPAPKAWDMGRYNNMVVNSVSTPVISMRNIHILTDYLSQSSYLTPEGDVRSVILSEMGYTSSQGQDLQAASFAYAYKIMMANSHIDYMLLSRHVDAPSEVAAGLALGILTSGHGKKTIYDVFKFAGTGSEAEYFDRYLGTIGISSWNQITNPR